MVPRACENKYQTECGSAREKGMNVRRARRGKDSPNPRATASLDAAEIGALYARLAAANPNPKGELAFVNPYTLLVAVVLSAQATDAGVNRVTDTLFSEIDTPLKMLALGEDRLRE